MKKKLRRGLSVNFIYFCYLIFAISLNDKLKEAVLDDIKNLDLYSMVFYAPSNNKTLKFLCDNNVVDEGSIESALEHAVFERAKKDYEKLTNPDNLIYPDHFGRPESLAYAINKGIFSEKQIRKIKFDYGEDAQSFSRLYGNPNLLSTLREELLNPKSRSEIEGYYDPHPVCECEY